MKFHTNIRYALTALVEITRQKPGEAMSLRNVADNIGLPLNYLEQIFIKLRKNGIVVSKRGSKGGYEITRKPSDISLYHIYKALDESAMYEHCKLVDLASASLASASLAPTSLASDTLEPASKCLSHNLWVGISKRIENTLKEFSLHDVSEGVSQQNQNESRTYKENYSVNKQKVTYLDHNSTSIPPDWFWEEICKTAKQIANPSSIHQSGRATRRILEDTRNILKEYCNLQNANITFTSGGTEANNMMFACAGKSLGVKNIIIGASEHTSVIKAAQKSQIPITIMECDQNGIYQPQKLDEILANQKSQNLGPTLVSLMIANNETGVIQNINEIAAITNKYNAYLHTDASQALGKIPLDFEKIKCHFMSLCAHKMGAFAGVGAFVSKVDAFDGKFIEGGEQEFGRRAGTENIVGIASWKILLEKFVKGKKYPFEKTRQLRDYMEKKLSQNIDNIQIVAKNTNRLPNTSMCLFQETDSRKIIIALDMQDIAVSNGAACSAGSVGSSHVLKAMGYSTKQMQTSVRISLGPENNKQDIEKFVATVTSICNRKYVNKKIAQKDTIIEHGNTLR